MRIPYSRLALLAAAAIVAAACTDRAGTAGAEPVVRDSAGITIVENAAPRWGEGEGWQLSEEPVVEIGVVEGTPEYQLSGVTGAARLSDGRIAVGDQGSHSVRYYDPDGRYRKSVGGRGEGPGEFGRMRRVDRLGGDTLAAVEIARVTVMDGAGEVAEIHGSLDPFTSIVGWFDDGSALGVRADGLAALPREGVASMTVVRVDLEAGDATELGSHPFMEFRSGSHGPLRVVFSPRAVFASLSGGYLYGFSETFELREFTLEGHPARIIRKESEAEEVASDHRAAYDSLVRTGPGADEREAMPFAETLPAFRRVEIDRGGHLWVEAFRLQHEIPPGWRVPPVPTFDEPGTWFVFDEEGIWLGKVEMPARFTPLEIGEDYVLGLARDEMDVESVRLYELVKPEGS